MGYESDMYAELQQDIKPRLAAIEKFLGLNQPVTGNPSEKKEEVEDLMPAPKMQVLENIEEPQPATRKYPIALVESFPATEEAPRNSPLIVTEDPTGER